MSEFVFHQVDDRILRAIKLPSLPFPVRKETERDIFGGKQVAFDLLLDELNLFLAEHPEHKERYRETVGLLAYTVGIEMGTEGNHDAAAHCFEIGLAYKPDNLSLQTNHALALQALGRKDEALAQFEQLINDPDVDVSPLVWIMAARLYSEKGDHARGYQLLKDCAPLVPEGDRFWELFTEFEKKAGVAPAPDTATKISEPEAAAPPAPSPAAPAVKYCTNCGAQLAEGVKFCTGCGAPVGKPAAAKCTNCGAQLAKGAKFCKSCGTPVGKPAAVKCTNCGAQLAEGAKFCTKCGTPVKR